MSESQPGCHAVINIFAVICRLRAEAEEVVEYRVYNTENPDGMTAITLEVFCSKNKVTTHKIIRGIRREYQLSVTSSLVMKISSTKR